MFISFELNTFLWEMLIISFSYDFFEFLVIRIRISREISIEESQKVMKSSPCATLCRPRCIHGFSINICITNACDDCYCISDVSVICVILGKINYYYYYYNIERTWHVIDSKRDPKLVSFMMFSLK